MADSPPSKKLKMDNSAIARLSKLDDEISGLKDEISGLTDEISDLYENIKKESDKEQRDKLEQRRDILEQRRDRLEQRRDRLELLTDIWIKVFDQDVEFDRVVYSMTVASYLFSVRRIPLASVHCFIKGSPLDMNKLTQLAISELSTSSDYPLVVQRKKYTGVPKSLSASASEVAKTKKPEDVFVEHPVYHWTLAYELKQAYEEALKLIGSHNSTITLTVLGDNFSVSLENLQTASRIFTQALNIANDEPYQFGMRADTNLACQEICFTATCAVALNKLLNSDRAFILHQGATKKKINSQGGPEAADLYGAVYDDSYRICTPILVGEGKKPGDYKSALTQTAKYAHDVMVIRHNYHIQGLPILLGLPFCKDDMSLYVYLMGQEKPWGMCIAKSSSKDLALYATIYAACQYMIKHHRVQSEDVVEKPCLYDLKPLNNRVFLDENKQKVWKFFNTSQYFFNVNWELLKLLFDDQKITHETIGSDLEVVKYNYIEGNQDPESFSQYKGVISMLHKVHETGYVHGDIRSENMVFYGDTSFLIDYDLARKEGECYPEEYVYDGFLMRHCDAKPFRSMKQDHDRYSLCYIMEQYTPQSASIKDIIARVHSGISLQELATEMEKPDWC